MLSRLVILSALFGVSVASDGSPLRSTIRGRVDDWSLSVQQQPLAKGNVFLVKPPFTAELSSHDDESPDSAYNTIDIDVKFGTVEQGTYTLRVNTGASSVWAKGKPCKYRNGEDCTPKTPFPSSDIPTASGNFTDPIADGVYYRNLSWSVPSIEPQQTKKFLPDMGLGSANRVANQFSRFAAANGELGLGRRDNSTSVLRPNRFIEQIGEIGYAMEITIHLKSAVKSDKHYTSTLTVGGASLKYCNYSTDVTIQAEEDAFWVFKTGKVKANGKVVCGRGTSALISNDHGFLEVPEAIYESKNIKDVYPPYTQVDCNEALKVKGFEFTTVTPGNPRIVTLDAKDLLYTNGTKCSWAVKSTSGKAWRLGSPLYRAYCVKHNYEHGEISFYEPIPQP